jgi:hypothetical protein
MAKEGFYVVEFWVFLCYNDNRRISKGYRKFEGFRKIGLLFRRRDADRYIIEYHFNKRRDLNG